MKNAFIKLKSINIYIFSIVIFCILSFLGGLFLVTQQQTVDTNKSQNSRIIQSEMTAEEELDKLIHDLEDSQHDINTDSYDINDYQGL